MAFSITEAFMELELGYMTQKISATRQVECNHFVGQNRKKKERTPVMYFGQVLFCRYLTLFYHKQEQFCTEIIVPNYPSPFCIRALVLLRSHWKGQQVYVVTGIIRVRLALLDCVSRVHEIETDLSCVRPPVIRLSVVCVAIISVPNAWISFKF